MSERFDRNIKAVYATSVLLGLAYGLAIAVVALFLDDIGYTKQEIGGLAAWFAGGIVLGSLPVGRLARRFGARAVLISSLLGYTVTVTLLPLAASSYWTLVGVRMADGIFSVGVWVGFETLLLQHATKANKGMVMSLYSIAIAFGYVAGPASAGFFSQVMDLSQVFFISGGVALVATLVATFALRPAAAVEHEVEAASKAGKNWDLLWKIKTSCLATYSYGYFQASIVLFLPLYLSQKGFADEKIVVIPAFFAVGMFVFSTFAGKLSDRFGHLLIMRWLAVIGIPAVIAVAFLDSYALIAACGFLTGASLATISPVSLALQGHIVDKADYAQANGIYNAFYALGMLIGPVVTAILFEQFSGAVMIYHLAGLWAFFVVFTLFFAADDPRVATRRAVLTSQSIQI